ncbi:MAG: MFS transporter [Candidatus Thermoplasmatota archaeon]|nr:MFS transporter [Candidatus Thermoplasmatota archaeon]MBU4072418.1 MFS transporter [Candidatus Thermoplasmatota archaeon]MBU4143990.1 MFS transporter [Candidatus Thermoplasmatota archaeon]
MSGKKAGLSGKFRGFSHEARTLIAAGLIDNMSFAINGFVLVLYLSALGYSYAFFGALSLIMEISQVSVLLASGFIADRFGRKKTILVGLVLGTLGMMHFAFFDTVAAFVIGSVLLGASSGFTGPAFSALLSEKTTLKRRKYLFSLNSIVANMGSGFITLVGGFIPMIFMSYFGFASEPAYRMIFVIVFLIKFIAIGLLLRIKTDKVRKSTEVGYEKAEKKHWILLLKFALPSALTGIGAGVLIPYFPIYFQLRFELDLGSIGILFAMLSFLMVLMTIYLPRLAEKKGTITITTAFHITSIIAMIAMPFTPWLYLVILLFLARAALMNVPGPIMTSFMMSHLPHSLRATAQSANGFAWMFTHAIGVFIGGFIWDTGDFNLAFYIAIILYILATVFYFGFFYRMDDAKHKNTFFWPILRHFVRK